MPQGEFVIAMLFLTFALYITARGELGTYIRLLV